MSSPSSSSSLQPSTGLPQPPPSTPLFFPQQGPSSPFPSRREQDGAEFDLLLDRLQRTWAMSPPPSTPSPSSAAASPSSTTATGPCASQQQRPPLAAMDAFLQNRSRVVKVLGLPAGVTQEELVKWIVRERRGRGESAVKGVWGERGGGGEGGWWVLFEEHEDARNSLRLSNSYFIGEHNTFQITVLPAQEQDLVPNRGLVDMPFVTSPQSYQTPPHTPSHVSHPHTRTPSLTSSIASSSSVSTSSPLASRSQIFGLSPISTQHQYQQQYQQQQQQQQDQLSSSGYAGLMGLGLGLGGAAGLEALSGLGIGGGGLGTVSFRPGDWICPSDNCSFHNFSRNDRCNSCGAFKPTSGSTGSHPRHHRTPSLSPQRYFNPLPSASSHATPTAPPPLARYYTSGPPAPPSHIQQQRSLTTSASNPDFFGAGAGRGLNFPSRGGLGGEGGGLGLSGLGSADVAERDGTTGGGDSGGNGRTRSVSYAGRGAGRGAGGGRGGGSAGMAPILNTGNVGVMVVQAGDWACGDCGFVNWRRRTVCLRCYPYAEGNEGTGIGLAQSAAMAAQLASLPNFNANSDGVNVNVSPTRTQNNQQTFPPPAAASAPSSTNTVRPQQQPTQSTSSNSSSSNETHGSPVVGSGRPTFISSGPYQPSGQQQQVDEERNDASVGTGVGGAVQRDVFGHVVSIQNGNGNNNNGRQRNASLTSGGGW